MQPTTLTASAIHIPPKYGVTCSHAKGPISCDVPHVPKDEGLQFVATNNVIANEEEDCAKLDANDPKENFGQDSNHSYKWGKTFEVLHHQPYARYSPP